MAKFYGKKDITKKTAMTVAILATVIKLALSLTQFATIYPPLAPIDDDLMFRRAQSIAGGKWLGEYGWLTISKHMGFSVWLAFLHKLKIPYLVGNMALWCTASAFCTGAFRPVLKKNKQWLFVYLLLAFNPAASASFSTRVYRDSVFPALCLMFFSGVCGAAFRRKENFKKILPWLCLYGLSFGAVYLTREDGIWVLPFFIGAGVIVTADLYKSGTKNIAKPIGAMLLPFVLSFILIGAYAFQNYRHYSRFIVSDFDSGEFKAAYGAMTSLKQESWNPLVAVPASVRADLYREIPMFAPVEEALEEKWLKNGYFDSELQDFKSGSFYWALRKALDTLGVYDSPQTARDYYVNLTAQIQKAVDEGRLKTTDGTRRLRRSLTPPIKKEYVLPVISQTFDGMKKTVKFADCDPLAQRAVGVYKEEIQPVEDFIHQKGATAMIENTDIPYLSLVRKAGHGILRFIRSLYAVFIPISAVFAFIWQIKVLKDDLFFKRLSFSGFLNIVMLGILLMMIFRRAMVGFMEVSSFGIGTYVMYLSTIHPLLILYCAVIFAVNFDDDCITESEND
jgi:hypothetical protein